MTDLSWGLQITAMGMGLVFGLLALLWGLLWLMLKLDRAPETAANGGPTTGAGPGPAAEVRQEATTEAKPALDPAKLAAIMIAVRKYRHQLRAEAAPSMRTHEPGGLLHASRWVDAGRMRQNKTWQRRR
jgi:glutaconyl-CoA/methylmalonyl-CoA decarboxylase subunit delta